MFAATQREFRAHCHEEALEPVTLGTHGEKERREYLEERERALTTAVEAACELAELTTRLPEAAKRIRRWVHNAEGDDLDLLLRALDLRVVASNNSVVITGSIPALEGAAKTGLPLHIETSGADLR